MLSIKKRIFLVIVLSVTLIGLALGGINIYVRDILISWDSINSEIRLIEKEYSQIDFKVRVLNNILGRVSTTQESVEVLLEPYERNHKNLLSINKELIQRNKKILYQIEEIKGYLLSRRLKDLDELENNMLEIASSLNNIQEYSLSLEDIFGEDNLYKLSLIDLEYEKINEELLETGNIINTINTSRSSMVLSILNIIFASFFFIIMGLAFLINRIIRTDIKYMDTALRLLNDGIYDVEGLPKFKAKYIEEKNIKENVEYIFREEKFLSEIKTILSGEYILDELIDRLLLIVRDEMKTNRVGVAFVDYDQGLVIAEHGAFDYGRALLGPGFSVKLKNTRLGKLVESKESLITTSINKDLEENPSSSSLKLLKREGINSNMIIPLIANDVVFGFLFFSSVNENNYSDKDLELGTKIGQEISGILNTSYLTKKMFITMVNSFADLVEKKDTETGNHIIRMTEYSRTIAEKLLDYENDSYRVNESFVNDIVYYSSAHDIGKVGIPDSILKKPGKLTDEERTIMETHTTIGAEVLIKVREDLKIFNREFFNVAIDIAMSHHERWDGSGYPNRLKGEDIPLSARIIAIADVFDALTSKRVYKPGFSFEDSLEIINQGSGSHFDPILVNIFNDSIEEIRRIYNNERLKD